MAMTEKEALEEARKQIRAKNAAYMREWRKKNPGREKKTREQKLAKKILQEEQKNE